MNILGIDIGTNLIKAVEVKKEKGSTQLLKYSYSSAFNEPLLSELSIDTDNFAKKLREFISYSSFSSENVIASLPESHVFTRVIELPKISKKEIEKAVFWEAEKYLPISIEDVNLNFQILPSDTTLDKEEKTEVLLIAAPKALVNNFVKILEKTGLIPLALEPESMAIARSICYNEESFPETLIINIGSESTTISILVNKYIRFTRNISTGGTTLIRAISQDIGLEMDQAEEYMKSYGLDESKMDGKISSSMEPVFNVILNEVRKSIAYFETKKSPSRVKRVVLCGGISTIPGILIYVAQYLNVEVQKANPWLKITVGDKYSKKELDELGPMFAASVGLVLKEV